jgi:prophage regulatory protein
MNNSTIVMLRKSEVVKKTGLAKSTLYNRVNDGLFPKPCNLGGRAVAWPTHEIDALLASCLAGASEEDIKILVTKLHIRRKELPLAFVS